MTFKKMTVIKQNWVLYFIVLFFIGCNEDDKASLPDTRERGTINVSADESFKPVIDAQVAVYESLFPNTNIKVHYKPEAECLNDFLVDSIRMIIATRSYTAKERQLIIDSMELIPKKMVVAYDAVTVIVNPGSPDSLFTMQEIRDLLTGRSEKKLIPVFDGVRATSTVRFIIDSVLMGKSLGTNVTAAKSSEEVIDYVSKTPNAVGFIGVSWIGNPEDSAHLSFLKKVNIAAIESTTKPGAYVLPVQANIYTGRYPMVRDLVYTLKEKHKGLGNGFANFLSGEKGQLIFRRSYLMPAQQKFNIRNAVIRE